MLNLGPRSVAGPEPETLAWRAFKKAGEPKELYKPMQFAISCDTICRTSIDGMLTRAWIMVGGVVLGWGQARCSPTDKYDASTGINIAIRRAFDAYYSSAGRKNG